MKLRFRLFPVFLSIMIVFLSLIQCSLTVYASSSGIHTDKDKAILNKFFEDAKYYVTYCTTQLGAIFSDYSFSKVMENKATWEDYWNGENIIVDSDSRTVTFSEDLTSAFKQALLEVAEETNGFRLYPTIDYDSIPASFFINSYDYKTFRNLVSESGCIIFYTSYFTSGGSMLYGRPFHDITEDSVSLVVKTAYSAYVIVEAAFVGTNTWETYTTTIKQFNTKYTDSDGYSVFNTFKSWDEGKEFKSNVYTGLLDMRGAYPTGSVVGYTFFSTDGRKLKVFNSLNALKNYTTGNRSVYFGSGFYDTPAEIKVSFDDLEKYMNTDYDKLLDELKDLIGKETDNEDSLTEEDLERLVDKLLEGLGNSGGGGSGGNDTPGTGGDNTGFLQGMLDSISGYLDSILEYLDGILLELGYISNQIDDLTADAVEEKTDSVLSELFSAFTEIGDLLKTKFPFSIPWDIYSILTFLGSDDPVDGSARAAPVSYFGDDGVMAYSADDGLVIAYDDITMSSSENLCIMPLMTDEDVNGSHGGGGASRPGSDSDSGSDDGSHGGGGASRPGSGSHYDSEGNYHRAPFYEIPFQISKSMGIEGVVVIDLDPFIPLSEISRTMFTCIFIMSLVNLSVKIIDALGDLFPSG